MNGSNIFSFPNNMANRRMICSGSAILEEKYNNKKHNPLSFSEYEIAKYYATRQAYLFLEKYNGHSYHVQDITKIELIEDKITEDMKKGADFFINYIKSIDMYKDKNHFFIYSYSHKFEEIYENWNILSESSSIPGVDIKSSLDLSVTVHLVQPRVFNNKNTQAWSMSDFERRTYLSKLKNLFSKIDNGDIEPDLTVSSECHFCTARHVCPALRNRSAEIIDQVYQEEILNNLTPQEVGDQLSSLLKSLEILNTRVSILTEEATYSIKQGKIIPGFKLETSRGSKKWNLPISEILSLGEVLGLNLKKCKDTITPNQAKELGMPEDILDTYTEYVPGKLKLISDNFKSIKKAFMNKE